MRLLDTTVAIDHLRGHAPARELLEALVNDDQVMAASEVVRFELLAGVRDDERGALETFCGTLAWVSIDEDVARVAGQMASRFRASHNGIDDVDYLIAATSLVIDAELLTTNVRHFPMLDGLKSPY